MLPSYSNEHLLRILEDVGITCDPSFGSPSTLLDIIRANEIAQADIAKAKEAASGTVAPLVVAGGGVEESDRVQVSSGIPKRGAGKRSKACMAPSRLSLRIKNLSHR